MKNKILCLTASFFLLISQIGDNFAVAVHHSDVVFANQYDKGIEDNNAVTAYLNFDRPISHITYSG